MDPILSAAGAVAVGIAAEIAVKILSWVAEQLNNDQKKKRDDEDC